MPYMRETAWAICQSWTLVVNERVYRCPWAESGPNVINAAVEHEAETGHVVLVGDRG